MAIAAVIGSSIVLGAAAPALACQTKPVVHKPVVHKVCPPKATPTPTPKPTTTPTPSPKPVGQVLGTSTTAAPVAKPATLPQTGAGIGLSALVGTPAMVMAGRAYLRSRRTR